MNHPTVDPQRLREARDRARRDHAAAKDSGLRLDITRGKPCSAQLDLSEPMLDILHAGDHVTDTEGDLRNYSPTQGLAELRAIFAPLLDVTPEQLVVRDNSSLSLMHQCVAASFFHAPPGGEGGWAGQTVRFLAPVPGYDRHFTVSSELGVELVTVPMTPDGPDMDLVEELVAKDPTIKGMWCVPKYSNPTGVTYSSETVRRLAAMETAAPDFRIYWDNAYAIHHLRSTEAQLDPILQACAEAGHPDRAFVFGSTSKVTFAGGGISFFASSPANVAWYLKRDGFRSIGPDKLNQLRHLRFFGSTEGVAAHMQKHREILEPKFDAVLRHLEKDLGDLGVAEWTDPDGGYFVSLDVVPGTAGRVVELAQEAGVALTPAGATFPGGVDPDDRNIRIAPTMPTTDDLETAMTVLTACVVIAAAERLLDDER
ncbi:aminotransferase class I/II-fold pyridoxal phosphate-dependent enzyme [Arsenicicoccus sp. oral taxon 190]|uniref:aminotransferase class I/II-fold pyridoxal phosphate-dependent enzyme n=1 Tax=Arsenicicoccus sp. oral taxon 190 TaxID=1658671 RepID=UPI00067A025C|nr:aminotransferase class I/II-fold pyridoxal phosphate-dependent enzyme [Arsenicicoccus sp. oral taxon 190]AKT50142.1 aminotransferase [Arsenicicoccus sp. oral taxon 190]